MQKVGGAGSSAPTGCFKCGRPGHWSRDCPSSSSSNPNPRLSNPPKSSSADAPRESSDPLAEGSVGRTVRKAPRSRPKLTPDLLLSDQGLGYVLKHFPRAFKYHGRGHEVNDLGNLIAMYAQWHSQLIPYYSFDQFIEKVEKVGSTKRVRACLRDLKQRVADGGDPTKLHEPPTEQLYPDCQPEVMETEAFDKKMMKTEVPDASTEFPPLASQDADDIEQMFNEIYQKATEEELESLQKESCSASKTTLVSDSNTASVLDQPQGQDLIISSTATAPVQITEEQRARMEANRLKALERAAACRALRAQAS